MAKRMSADAGEGHNSGADPDTILEHKRIIEQALVQQSQANAMVQLAYKRAKSAGCPIEAMKLERKLQKMDASEMSLLYRDVVRVAEFSGRPLGFQNSLFGATDDQRPTANAMAAYQLGAAEQAGYTDATQGSPIENCPHAAGTELAAAWTTGWHGGHAFMQRSGKLQEQTGTPRKRGRRSSNGEAATA